MHVLHVWYVWTSNWCLNLVLVHFIIRHTGQWKARQAPAVWNIIYEESSLCLTPVEEKEQGKCPYEETIEDGGRTVIILLGVVCTLPMSYPQDAEKVNIWTVLLSFPNSSFRKDPAAYMEYRLFCIIALFYVLVWKRMEGIQWTEGFRCCVIYATIYRDVGIWDKGGCLQIDNITDINQLIVQH